MTRVVTTIMRRGGQTAHLGEMGCLGGTLASHILDTRRLQTASDRRLVVVAADMVVVPADTSDTVVVPDTLDTVDRARDNPDPYKTMYSHIGH